MKKDLSLAASIVLILSILIIMDRLMATPNIQIVLENGRAVPLESASFFTLSDVVILIICAWAGGMAFIYLFTRTSARDVDVSAPAINSVVDKPAVDGVVGKPAINSVVDKPAINSVVDKPAANSSVKIKPQELALDILDGDEKIVFARIVESGEGILQRDIVLKTGFSEAKVSRLLDRLERRQLIVRRRYGMGNVIMLK